MKSKLCRKRTEKCMEWMHEWRNGAGNLRHQSVKYKHQLKLVKVVQRKQR